MAEKKRSLARRRWLAALVAIGAMVVFAVLLTSWRMPRGADGYDRARFTRDFSIAVGPARYTIVDVVAFDPDAPDRPGEADDRPAWPRGVRESADWVHAVRVRFEEDPPKSDVSEVRVFDSATRTRLNEGVTTRWLAPDELLLVRHGAAFPAQIDLWLRVIAYQGTERYVLQTRPMSTVSVPNGTIRMQQVSTGLYEWQRQGRNFATVGPSTGARPAAEWSSIYIQWTSNRKSPTMTGIAVDRDGRRTVFAPGERFSTLDPLGLYGVRMRHADLDHVEWRERHSSEPIVFRRLDVPPPTAPPDGFPPLEFNVQTVANRHAGRSWGAAETRLHLRLPAHGDGYLPELDLSVSGFWLEAPALRWRTEEGDLLEPERLAIARRRGATEPEMSFKATFPVTSNRGTLLLFPSEEGILPNDSQ